MAVPGYLEDTAKDYAAQAATAYKTPLKPSTFMGDQFVAPMDQMQTDAITMAQQGVGSYKPYLTSAQANLTAAGTAQAGLGALTGPGAGTGAGSISSFMSPYQQDVIDTSLDEFDRQAQMRQQQMQDQTMGVPGAFGGGREGVQLAEYQAGSDRNRLALQAQMLQQGFQNAQQQRQQAFGNQQQIAQGQMGLGSAQMGLSNFERAGLGGDIGAYGQLGSMRQGQEQARLTGRSTNETSKCLRTLRSTWPMGSRDYRSCRRSCSNAISRTSTRRSMAIRFIECNRYRWTIR